MSITTQELVSIIKSDFASDVSRPRILSYLNRAQKELFNNDCAQMVFLNGADPKFPYPILVTTAGQLEYNIDGSTLVDSSGNPVSLTKTDGSGNTRAITCRKINHIFIMQTGLRLGAYKRMFYGEGFQLVGLTSFWNNRLQSVSFVEVPGFIDNRTEYSPTQFTFAEDPLATTDKYYVEFYYGCPDLSSESVPLSVDGDKWGEALICGIQGYIEQWRNGNTNRLTEFRTYWKLRFKDAMNSTMAQQSPLQMPVRRFA